MRFLQVDVFAERPYLGNPLAVFPEAGELRRAQMQAIAREINLSESAFVTRSDRESYDVRIFTPSTELSFAGHPTIGTAWVLRHLGVLDSEEVVQRSGAGETEVRQDDDLVWFTRTGEADRDLEEQDRSAPRRLAAALGIEERDVGLEARELGRSGRLRPAFADAGLRQLMVPVRDLSVLGSMAVREDLLATFGGDGAYCFTATQAGRLRARGFFPSVGVLEDPATGSAAASLGLYLTARIGDIELEITQGIEVQRGSKIRLRARAGSAQVGGRCELVLEGKLSRLP